MPQRLHVCLVDMNNGVANQGIRCFKQLVAAFRALALEANPNAEIALTHVQPRNLGEEVPGDADLVLSSGGPGSPYDGWDDPWCAGYRRALDRIVGANRDGDPRAPKALLVCHSFELGVLHFRVAAMRRRTTLKFGLMPAYTTRAGREVDFLRPFADRLFAWEHRNWEAVEPDAARFAQLGGAVLATESREELAPEKGRALLALKFAPGVWGTQFHPEADRPGVMAWIEKPEHKVAVTDAYGQLLYERMVKSLADPDRLGKTFSLLVPGWLVHRFNELAPARGLRPVAVPDRVEI